MIEDKINWDEEKKKFEEKLTKDEYSKFLELCNNYFLGIVKLNLLEETNEEIRKEISCIINKVYGNDNKKINVEDVAEQICSSLYKNRSR